MKRTASIVVATVLVALGGLAGAFQGAAPRAKGGGSGFEGLTATIKESPGCLGVETAKTSSGKEVLFAWFEDKAAIETWYYGDAHRAMMKQFSPASKLTRRGLGRLPEKDGPILVIASMTPNDKPTKDNPAPFKQLAIETYQPLDESLAINGRFAPETLKLTPARPDPRQK